MESIKRIISAKDYGGSGKGYIRKQQEHFRKRGIIVTVKDIDKPTGKPVEPEIWQGQWIARCEDCNGASFIDPDEPMFFCFGCGNRSNGGACRPVLIPDDWREIENALLERPVNDVAGLTDLERAGMAKAFIVIQSGEETLPLVRSWKYGETVSDLHDQQDKPIKEWHRNKEDKHGL